jgi:hypothetical protein
MTPMHEEMHAAANQQEQKRPRPQKVNPVLENQKHAGNSQKHAERQSNRGVQEWPLLAFGCLRLAR